MATLALLLVACSSGHKAEPTAATTNPTLPRVTPTTRDLRVPVRCAAATRAVVNYVVGGELHGRLPVGGDVPTATYDKPAFRALLIRSLDECPSRETWLRAFVDYTTDASVANSVLGHACQLEPGRPRRRAGCR